MKSWGSEAIAEKYRNLNFDDEISTVLSVACRFSLLEQLQERNISCPAGLVEFLVAAGGADVGHFPAVQSSQINIPIGEFLSIVALCLVSLSVPAEPENERSIDVKGLRLNTKTTTQTWQLRLWLDGL